MKPYAYYTFLGVGAYMTYFCMIASVNYWNYFYDMLFTTIISFVFNTADFLGVLLSPVLQRRINEGTLIYICFGTQFACITALIPMHYVGNKIAKYILAQAVGALCGAASGLFMSAINAVASVNGKDASHGVEFGVGVSEVFVELIKLFFAAIEPYIPGDQEKEQMIMQFCYFGAAELFIVFEFYCWFKLSQLFEKQQLLELEDRSLVPESQTLEEWVGTKQESIPKPMQNKEFVKQVAISFFGIFINYMETYFIFPAVITAVPCRTTFNRTERYRNEWWILINLSVYLFSDCLGRLLANCKLAKQLITVKVAFFIAIIRIVFVVLFILETLPRIIVSNGELVQKPIIFVDLVSIIVSCLFGLQGGITVASIFMREGDVFSDKGSRKRASNWITIGISTACMISGIISIPMAGIVQYE